MKKTFEMMSSYLQDHHPNEHWAGRTSTYNIPDMLDRGEHLVYNISGKASVPEDDSVDQVIEEEDLSVEYTE
jgi:hypothetical protein